MVSVYERRIEQLEAQNLALTRHAHELLLEIKTAQEFSRLKSEFLATMSHELRTPLTAILGFTELLLEGLDGALNEKQQNAMLRVSSNGKHLLYLINQILDVAKIEAGQLELDEAPFDVRDWLAAVVFQAAGLAEVKGLSFDANVDDRMPDQITGDANRYKQIILNLVSNAVKFTEDGFVRLHLSMLNQDQWMIQVSDTGIGISSDAHKIIFEDFKQVDSGRKQDANSTGLGLAIVRNLAHVMGGKVAVESDPGEGSTFTVTLPLIRVNGTQSLEDIRPIAGELS